MNLLRFPEKAEKQLFDVKHCLSKTILVHLGGCLFGAVISIPLYF